MFDTLRSLFHPQPSAPPVPPAPSGRRLDDEYEAEFFTWFHLEPDDAPVRDAAGIRHRFRPSGDAFRGLVVLDIITDDADGIRSAHLCLDRSFVSGPEDAFARDIAKSFLGWILDGEAQQEAAPLIANIGNLAAANAPVIAAEVSPLPPADTSGAYAVYMGDGDAATLMLGSAMLTLANAGGRLTIDAHLEG